MKRRKIPMTAEKFHRRHQSHGSPVVILIAGGAKRLHKCEHCGRAHVEPNLSARQKGRP